MADEVPEVFSDVFDLALTPYGVTVTFAKTARKQPGGDAPVVDDQAVVRMSLEQAKVLSLLLRKNLSHYEIENQLEIPLPHTVYQALGVGREDWPQLGG